MATRIIQVNYSEEFLEQFKKDGFYKQSQKRSGSTAKLSEGDTVFVFLYKEEIYQGEIRFKCSASKINEIISDDGELYATLTIEEMYDEGFCTYEDLLDKGFIRNRFFHWNILPELAAFIEENNKSEGVQIKQSIEKPTTDRINGEEKREMAIDEKKKDVKKQPVKKDEKKKDSKKQPVKKVEKKKAVKKQPVKKADKKKDEKKQPVKKADKKKDVKKQPVKKADKKKDVKKQPVKKADKKKDVKKK